MPRVTETTTTITCDDGCNTVITDNNYIEVSYVVFQNGVQVQQASGLIFVNAQHLMNFVVATSQQPNPVVPVNPPPIPSNSEASWGLHMNATDA